MFFFIGQKLAFKKRSGMILEVQIQNFGTLTYQSFHFQKIPGGLNINIFCENWHKASFYIKAQVQIFVVVVEMLVLKTILFYPRKRGGGFGF